MMDEKTRFQLVSMIAETREAQGAKSTFRKSKEVPGKKPRLVVTDGLQGDHFAFSSEFYDRRQSVKHIANVALQSGLNNSIERMQGSIREPEKVMPVSRAWKPLYQRQQDLSQFRSTSQALRGMTPAEAAGIGVEGNNRWIKLLNASIRFEKVLSKHIYSHEDHNETSIFHLFF